jgi:hypothetical protein
MTIAIGEQAPASSRSMVSEVRRRGVIGAAGNACGIIDQREHDICRQIVLRIADVLQSPDVSAASLKAISSAFDENIVAAHLDEHHGFQAPVATVLSALHTLSEQSYENRALTFGCILDPEQLGQPSGAQFPEAFLESKKYKALSDGFRTAYVVSTDGRVQNFVDLERYELERLSARHYFPEWTEAIARASRAGRCGIVLSRQGDILIFDEGTLRFSYRYGRWQYWNHVHIVNLLRDQARAQRVPPNLVGRVVGAVYRAALDVAFRRSGGLFVLLHNRQHLRKIVKVGDAIGDHRRGTTDQEFDGFLASHTIQSLARSVVVELASLDGAVVLDNSGRVLAYGAILQPKRAGRIRGSEGSRTKAAIGASHYGLAVKVSSDGDIVIYNRGHAFIRI